MGEKTGIPWTRSTFNPWIGCTKVGRGCDNCYAETFNIRFRKGANWGPGAPRHLVSDHAWNEPIRWDRKAASDPDPWWVFAASHADIFDNEVDPAWRARFWQVVRDTPHLRWQIVTKRIGNVAKMVPPDWPFRNVILIVTVVDQQEADRDVPKLLATPAAARGLSIEPQVDRIALAALQDATNALGYGHGASVDSLCGMWAGARVGATGTCARLDWVISGGESGAPSKVRPYRYDWAVQLLRECRREGVPFFMKQLGVDYRGPDGTRPRLGMLPDGSEEPMARELPERWPPELRVREMPRPWWN